MLVRTGMRLGPGIVAKKKSGFMKRTFRVIAATTGAMGATYGSVFFYLKYRPIHSLNFLMQPPELDAQMDKEFGVDYSFMSTVMNSIFWNTMGTSAKEAFKTNLSQAQQLIDRYPTSVIGYMITSWLYRTIQDKLNAESYFQRALDVFNKHPDKNTAFSTWMPTSMEEYKRMGIVEPTEVSELIPGKIWTAIGYWKNPKVPDPDDLNEPMLGQASIVKLRDGKLVIINPVRFDAKSVEAINKIGPVGHMVTTCIGHGNNLADATLLWPDAKIYGTDVDKKHSFPKLNWSEFLNDSDQLFGSELSHKKLDGHMFNEHVFYHPESKTLLGPVDMAISTPANKAGTEGMLKQYKTAKANAHSITGAMYFCGQGLWRGTQTPPIACQSYHYAFTSSRPKLARSVNQMLEWDFDRVVLGHGGIVEGPEAKQQLAGAFKWVTNPDVPFALSERLVIPAQWMVKNQIVGAFIKMVKNMKPNENPTR